MSILIQKAGICSTVQDVGRLGFRRFGINPNGAMDRAAIRLLNALLGNEDNEPVLEMHFPASEIRFENPALFSLGGAFFRPMLNNKEVENWRIHPAENGDILRFKEKLSGSRAYLAIKGGFEIGKWLNSSSTNLTASIGGFEGRKLQKGDRLIFQQSSSSDKFTEARISNSLVPHYSRFPTIRVIPGAEFELLTGIAHERFLKNRFTITPESDRMGFRLKGEQLHTLGKKEILSSAVDFGTIQLMPSGELVILMADHQTSGGYPRIAHVIGRDLPLLAQLEPNDKIGFHLITIEEAEDLYLEFEQEIRMLRLGVRFAGV